MHEISSPQPPALTEVCTSKLFTGCDHSEPDQVKFACMLHDAGVCKVIFTYLTSPCMRIGNNCSTSDLVFIVAINMVANLP